MTSFLSYRLPIFHCIAVLAVVTIHAIDTKVEDNETPDPELTSKYGFLFGERTPVWLATNPRNGSSVVYSRMMIDIMKRAMIDWKSKGRRSIKLDPAIDVYARYYSKDVPKSPVSADDVIYLSILVVMDYGVEWSKSSSSGADRKYENIIRGVIPYAMAFWNSVDLSMRFLDPKVRIRIVGIVIGENRAATPYIYENISPANISDEKSSISSMYEYWEKLSATHKDFTKDAYDCIVTLTNIRPRKTLYFDFDKIDKTMAEKTFKILPFMVKDDMAFGAVKRVADHLIKIVSGDRFWYYDKSTKKDVEMTSPPSHRPYRKLRFSTADRKSFFESMASPKVHHDPGHPLETILPGQLMSAVQQCTAQDKSFANICTVLTRFEEKYTPAGAALLKKDWGSLPMIMSGDFNVNFAKLESQPLIDFLEGELNLKINSSLSTPTTRSGTTIDAVFSKHLTNIKSQTFVSYFSDHKPIVTMIKPDS